MKNLKKIFAALAITFGCYFIQSCEDRAMVLGEADGTNSVSTQKKMQGTLMFRAITPADTAVANVLITIETRQVVAPKDQDGFSMQATTNAAGVADFGELKKGTYFFRAERRGHHESGVRTGYATVQPGKTTEVLLTFN